MKRTPILTENWKRVVARLIDLALIFFATISVLLPFVDKFPEKNKDVLIIVASNLIFFFWFLIFSFLIPLASKEKTSLGKKILKIGYSDRKRISPLFLFCREFFIMILPFILAAGIFYFYTLILSQQKAENMRKIISLSSGFVLFWFVFLFLFQKINPKNQLFYDRYKNIYIVELTGKKIEIETNKLKSLKPNTSMEEKKEVTILNEHPRLESLLKNLNKKQREAVVHNYDQSLLILAGPGTGKTTVLMSRMAALIKERGLRSKGVLALTFTKKACENLRVRLKGCLQTENEDLSIFTFHGFSFFFLQNEKKHLNLKDGDIIIIDEKDRKKIIKNIIKDQKWNNEDKELFSKEVSKISNLFEGLMRSRIKNFEVFQAIFKNPENRILLGDEHEKKTWDIFQKYLRHKEREGFFDFIDLIGRAVKILKNNFEVLQKWRKIYAHILVDEFQDTNEIQNDLISILSNCGAALPVTAVGDPDQTIYGWRGSDIRFINNFSKVFLPCSVVKLEMNYRSTPEILEFAEKIIEKNKNRIPRKIISNKKKGSKPRVFLEFGFKAQAVAVAEAIREDVRNGVSMKEIAVLYRNNHLSGFLEKELIKKKIPFVIVKGLDFFRRIEIREFNIILQLLFRSKDLFSEAVLSWVEGIGEVSIRKIRMEANDRNQTLFSFLLSEQFAALPKFEKFKPKINDLFSRIKELRELLRKESNLSLKLLLIKILNEIYEPILKKRYIDYGKKINYIETYIAIIDSFAANKKGEPSIAVLRDFLTQIQIDIPGEAIDPTDKVQLMTIHAAKGLEFDNVYIFGVCENVFPSQWTKNIEEERRLFFVATTRPRNQLTITGNEFENSKFIEECTKSLLSVL